MNTEKVNKKKLSVSFWEMTSLCPKYINKATKGKIQKGRMDCLVAICKYWVLNIRKKVKIIETFDFSVFHRAKEKRTKLRNI